LKRSNRLILLIGVLLAAVAFVGVIMLTGTQTPSSQSSPPPTTTHVVVAKVDIQAGTKLTAAMIQLNEVPITAAPGDAINDTSLAIGKRVFRPVSVGEQITFAYFIESGAQTTITDSLPKGLRGMAIQVDQVTGVGTLIHTGDSVDIIVSVLIQSVLPDPVNKGQVIKNGDPQISVKLILQNIQVIGTELPPPVAQGAAAATPAPSGQAPAQAGTNLTGQNEILLVAVTANQAEVIRWAQLGDVAGGAADRGTTALAVVLRSPKDYVAVDASGSPVLDSNGIPVTVVPPLEKTDGVILKTLIEKYGVLPPDILIK
jgi:Flp pilus assembly protein CpaB